MLPPSVGQCRITVKKPCSYDGGHVRQSAHVISQKPLCSAKPRAIMQVEVGRTSGVRRPCGGSRNPALIFTTAGRLPLRK
jgi:hypothetical protein